MTKWISLDRCVKEVICPGISLHFSFTHNRPMAFAWEVIRQFSTTKLDLHLVGTGFLEYAIALIWAGQVKKLEGAFFGETYPAPRPSRLIMTLAREGQLDIEYWTNLTIPQRFMAAAYGWDFIPTRSLVHSSLLEEHLKSGKALVFRDPLTDEETVLIRKLQPDVAVVHGSVADPEGNVVINPPYGEDLWGVFAARKVVALVEKVVDKSTIQALSHLVKIPGHKVDYLVEVPFGAHPYGVSPIGYRDTAYGEDYEFRQSFSRAVQERAELYAWMQQWDLDQSHDAFIRKLGAERLEELRWRAFSPTSPATHTDQASPPTPTEKLIVAASRWIAEKVKKQGIQTILAGIGVSHLTAWLVHKRLKEEGHPVQLMTETGYYGYDPVEGDPYIFNFGNLFTNCKQSSFMEILGQFVGDPCHRSLAILSAAQIDAKGNLNSTKIPEKNLFLTGSGGANDIASVAYDVVVMMDGDSRKFVKQVPYITSPGDRVSTVFTSLAVLAKNDTKEPFSVSAWIPQEKLMDHFAYQESLAQLISWELPAGEGVPLLAEPSKQELEWLRSFDPQGEFLR